MRLYVAWYPGDPVYPRYDGDCALLISPTSVANRWRVRDLSHPPRWLMVDSGGFRYSLAGEYPTQKQVLEQQLRLIDRANCAVTLCQLDHPVISKSLTDSQKDRQIHRTLANAYELRRLTDLWGLPANVETMAVVQGYDAPSLAYCARELKAMGYNRFGIGSLAQVNLPVEVTNRIRAVVSVVGEGVHIFGVTSQRMAAQLQTLGVGSLDSSSAAKAAMFNVVFASHPFRRQQIRPTRGRHTAASYLDEAYQCPCPACEGRANADLLKLGKRRFVFLRTLHNYYHLKCAVTNLEQFVPPPER